MSDLLIRNVPARMKRQLQDRARANGRSLSEEAKLLLRKALVVPKPKPSMAEWMRSLVEPEDRGDDLVFEYHGNFPKPPNFD
ncbi:MAG TPA: plasmid stabilization protein [Xanthobacteraceae bacterium]|jgi:plasmid stability protein